MSVNFEKLPYDWCNFVSSLLFFSVTGVGCVFVPYIIMDSKKDRKKPNYKFQIQLRLKDNIVELIKGVPIFFQNKVKIAT